MNRFRECREASGLTQKYVALTLGVKGPSVSNWESGKTTPTTENIAALAKLYNVSVDYLLGRDEGQSQISPSPADRQRRDVEAMLRAMSEADLEKVYDYARFITRDKK